MATVTIRPTSTLITVPDYQHWAAAVRPSGISIANRYTLVDEVVTDEDTTCFQCSTTIHSFEHFGMGATGVSDGVITNVRVYFRCKHATATGYSRAVFGGVGGVVGDTKTSTTSYQTFTQDWAVNPATSSAWAWSDFTNYFGVEGWASANKSNNWCTQFYVEITYSTPSTVVQGCTIQGCTIK